MTAHDMTSHDANSQDVDARYALAQAVIAEAAEIALGFFRDLSSLTIEEKGPQDLVSQADRTVEAHIRGRITEAFPDDGFVGEESGSAQLDSGKGAWVVDPIDGTQPFLLGLPFWCISIAYVYEGEIEIGLITNPVTGDSYAARRGAGATRNGSPIHVRPAARLTDGVTGVGCSPRTRPQDLALIMDRLLSAGGMYLRIGSGALNMVYVAAGQLIGYVEMHINAWDCLAAIRINLEAGAVVNEFLRDNGVTGAGRIIVGAPGVYPALEELLP